MRRGMRRPQPGRPGEGWGEALAALRGCRHPAGRGVRPGPHVDHALLPETLDALKDFQPLPAAVNLDAGYDYRPCREALDERGLRGEIAHRGEPAPIQAGKRWVIERTNSWLNDFGKIRRCTERRRSCVDAYLALAAAIVTVRALYRAAWYLYRWDTRPRSPRIC
jgi:Transposase DDE domain